MEPGETVLIGAVTSNSGSQISLNTVDIALLTDSRLSTNPSDPTKPVFLNDSGFEITLASILPDPTTPQLPGTPLYHRLLQKGISQVVSFVPSWLSTDNQDNWPRCQTPRFRSTTPDCPSNGPRFAKKTTAMRSKSEAASQPHRHSLKRTINSSSGCAT